MTWELNEAFDTGDGIIRWTRLGAGEPVVLTHGAPFSSFLWREIAPALAQTRQVFLWDLLGYGQSDKHQDQDVSLAAQGRLLARLVAHWGLDRPALVGHDFGGAITLRAYLLEHVAARRLTLVDAVGGGRWGTGLFRLAKSHLDVFRQLPGYAHEALLASHIRTATVHGLPPAVLDAYLSPWLGAEGQAAYCRQVEQTEHAHTDEYQHLLGTISIPVDILWGRDDAWLPASQYADPLREAIPHATFSWIENAGHLIHEDSPAQLTAHLLNPG